MNKYLLIENVGECPVEGFTILGLSSARGKASSIGQFGSGNKHAINILLRNGLDPTIYIGRDKLTFSTRAADMNGTSYAKVVYSVGNAAYKDTGWCLEFGGLDWRDIGMALREFISNAIDAVDGKIEKTRIILVDSEPRAKAGYTRIFIPISREVLDYYNNIQRYFLHFNNDHLKGILNKSDKSPARIYRKGVLVRQMADHNHNSLFDYNFGESLKIDEARNLDDANCLMPVAVALSQDVEATTEVFRAMARSTEHYMEITRLHKYYLTFGFGYKETYQNAWSRACGDAIAVASQVEKDYVEKKGYRAIIVGENWFEALDKAGIKTTNCVLNGLEKKGNNLSPATKPIELTANKVWGWLRDLNMTGGKQLPALAAFTQPMDAGMVVNGFYDNGTVYINTQSETNEQVMLEELAHYITGANDNARDFQDFAFMLATQACKVLCD